MTKVERYMSGDEEFTGTKQEVLEYELRMSRQKVINNFCETHLNPDNNSRETVAEFIADQIENMTARIKAEKDIILQNTSWVFD